MIVALSEMVEHDPTICELADLPCGWCADRDVALGGDPANEMVAPNIGEQIGSAPMSLMEDLSGYSTGVGKG